MWKQRFRKFADNPPVVFSYLRARFWYPYIADTESANYDVYDFLDSQQTINALTTKDCSLIRIGDGTFGYLNGHSIYFQSWHFRHNRGFAQKLEEALMQGQDENILFCLPHTFVRRSKEEYRRQGTLDEWRVWVVAKVLMKRYLRKEKTYGDSVCFHPRYNLAIDYPALKRYLDKKHVIIIASNIERFGNIELGRSTTLIEGAGNDAWREYEVLEQKALALVRAKGFLASDVLFMISAAEAAKVMVYDLTKAGYTAWDTGQFFDLAAKEISVLGIT